MFPITYLNQDIANYLWVPSEPIRQAPRVDQEFNSVVPTQVSTPISMNPRVQVPLQKYYSVP